MVSGVPVALWREFSAAISANATSWDRSPCSLDPASLFPPPFGIDCSIYYRIQLKYAIRVG